MLPILEKEIMLVSQMGCRRAVLHPYFADSLRTADAAMFRSFPNFCPRLKNTM